MKTLFSSAMLHGGICAQLRLFSILNTVNAVIGHTSTLHVNIRVSHDFASVR